MTVKTLLAAAVMLIVAAAAPRAQDSVAWSGYQASYRPGWTFTPSMGVSETYDDNVSLFDVHIAPEENNDFVTGITPAADLHYYGAHTNFGVGYTGSLLAYRTFDTLDRWAQHGRIEFKRQESARLFWNASANADSTPTTDAILFGGLPYRRTGSKTADGRAVVEYHFTSRDSVIGSTEFQVVHFDKPESAIFLQGGHAVQANGSYRHLLSGRLGIGADYGIRRASVIGDPVPFLLHSIQGAVDYELSPSWSMSALAGIVYQKQNDIARGESGPAYRVGVSHHRGSMALRMWYLHSFTPSFAFGGTVQTHEAGFGLRTSLFHSRRFYTDQSFLFRDDQPLSNLTTQLPLRQLRTNSIFGWMPDQWVRIEAFYTHAQQSTLVVGGDVRRNRIGVQVVTSKPVRIQ